MAEGRGREPVQCGFHLHMFHDKAAIQLNRCGGCLKVLDNPLQITTCGHQFCKACLPENIRKCPVCDKDFKKNEVFPDELTRQRIDELKALCPDKKCKWKGTFKEYKEKHKQECPCKPVECNNVGCRKQVPQGQLEDHQEKECEHRREGCQHCDQIITVKSIKAHEDVCKRIKLDCPNKCTIKIPREEIPKHTKDDCERTVVDCIYKKVGCDAKVERSELANHLRDSIEEHLSLSMLVLNQTNKEKEQMTVEINQLKNQNGDLTTELHNLKGLQETNFSNITQDVKQMEEAGTNRLDAVQQATEQNYDSLMGLVHQNDEINKVAMLLHQQVQNIRVTTIAPLQTVCLSHYAAMRKTNAEQEKLRKLSVGIFNHFTRVIGELKNNIERQMDKLSRQHEQDKENAMEFERQAKDRMRELEHAIQKNREELRTQKAAFDVEKDANEDHFQHASTQMERDYETLAEMITNEKRARLEASEIVIERLAYLELRSLTVGSLMWRVTGVNSQMTEACEIPAKAIIGPVLLSEQQGYHMQPKLFLNGARAQDRGHISIFVQLVPSPNDAALQWPFRHRVRFTLIDQQRNTRLRQDIQKEMSPNADVEELRRPDVEPNNGYGIYRFVEHRLLPSNYIVDDTMYVRIEVLANEDPERHSETI